MKILTLLFLTTTTLLAMDGDEKELRAKPKTYFSDSIEDIISELVRSEEMQKMELRKTQPNTRPMLPYIRKRETAPPSSTEDSLGNLIAKLLGLNVGESSKGQQTGFKSRFGGGK